MTNYLKINLIKTLQEGTLSKSPKIIIDGDYYKIKLNNFQDKYYVLCKFDIFDIANLG